MPGPLRSARLGPRAPRPSGPTRLDSLRSPRIRARAAPPTLLVLPPRSWPAPEPPRTPSVAAVRPGQCCRRCCTECAQPRSLNCAPKCIFLSARSAQQQTRGWTARSPPHCSEGPVRLTVPAPQAERARAVPGCAPLLSAARTPPTSRRNNQQLAAGLRAAQPRRVPEAPPPAARPHTPPRLRAPRPPAGPRWMLCNSSVPRLLPTAHWLPETRATGPESHWGARRDPALPPLRPPRPTLFSHPRCEGRGNWEEKGRGGL